MDSRTNEHEQLVTQPVQIGDGVYWVGRRPPGQIFYANPYLIHVAADRPFTMVVDPGAPSEFSVIAGKIKSIVPNLEDINAIFINHQDPDVGSSAGMMLQRYCPNAKVLCSEDTWRLVQYYNIARDRYVPLERLSTGIRTPAGRMFIPVPSPFCHFVGAVMLYDPENQILFSGDLFGSLTAKDAMGLWADESDWIGMRAFHQLYMPTNKALKHAISAIRKLTPDVKIIAPQHGRLIRDGYVEEFLGRLEHLEVGLDILDEKAMPADVKRAWTGVFARTLSVAREMLGDEAELVLIDDPTLANHIEFHGRELVVNSDTPKRALERMVALLVRIAPPEIAQTIKYEALVAAHDLDLPTPTVELNEG